MSSRKLRPLTFTQHMAVVGSRMFLGALTGMIRMTQGATPEGWRTLRYGLHRDETLDYIEPPEGVERLAPVVFFHGGGWMMGNTGTYSHDLLFLAEAGYPIFNVEYPKAPEHHHPGILRSVFQALIFIKGNFGANEVHLMGDSAGGNLAVMAGLLADHPSYLTAVDKRVKRSKLPKILSVTSIYGVLDRATCLNGTIPAGDTMLESYAGPGALGDVVDDDHRITPMDLIFKKHPPCLLVCGDADPLLASQSIYAARLSGEGHEVKTAVYSGGLHGFFTFPESGPKAMCCKDILAFLDGVTAKN